MKNNIDLQPYHSFGFPIIAKHLVEITSVEQLQELIQTPEFQQEKRLILSGGNNILFTGDRFDGLVILMNTKGIEVIHEDGDDVIVRAQAGEDWPEFVRQMVAQGLYGVENLAHIPGKVGAAPVQNIGAYGMELKDCFLQCRAMNLTTGKMQVFTNEACRFGYRESVFKHELKGQYVIVSVDFQLSRQGDLKLEYGNIRSYLSEHGMERPSLQQLHDAICAIRDAKLPDVKQIGSAGSFFKNPVISAEQFEGLQRQYPDIPHYPDAGGMVKVPAGWLIEHSGPSTDSDLSWKGWRNAHVGVYEKQALVLVHYGGGKSQEIVELSQKIQQSVEEKFGIQIRPEVNFI